MTEHIHLYHAAIEVIVTIIILGVPAKIISLYVDSFYPVTSKPHTPKNWNSLDEILMDYQQRQKNIENDLTLNTIVKLHAHKLLLQKIDNEIASFMNRLDEEEKRLHSPTIQAWKKEYSDRFNALTQAQTNRTAQYHQEALAAKWAGRR